MTKPRLARLLLVICCLLTGCSSVIPASSGGQPTVAPSGPQPQHIALLLPLQGEFGGSAQAIKNGFLAAYYNDKQHQANAPQIDVIDTSNKNAISAYQQALTNGADFVVGPLTKPQVQAVANQGSLTKPTLALNTLDKARAPSNLYFYSLSPRDEAVAAAQKAGQEGHHNVIIIASANPWGQSMAAAFAQKWKAQGGQVVGQLAFGAKQDLASSIGDLLQVNKDVLTSKGFKQALKDKTPLNQLHRQDFDAIFLAATPAQARLIKPILRFYFVTTIPVYSTSAVYSGKPAPMNDQDLNGIIFCDMPWVLENNAQLPANIAAIQSRVKTLWPDSYNSYSKLYAMGVDAYLLITHLSRLGNSPSSGISGATGTLYFGTDGKINRQLTWAQFHSGVPVVQ